MNLKKLNKIDSISFYSFMQVTGIIILRNSSGYVRARYSTFFAWFGSISLEVSHDSNIQIPN